MDIDTDRYGRVSGKGLAKVVSQFVNSGGDGADAQEFAQVVTNDHRTLQQKTTALFLTAIIAQAESADEGWTDLRNEASAAIAQKVRDLLVAENVFIRDGIVKFPFV